LKPVTDSPYISGKFICAELELNPRILRMVGIMTTFNGDALVDWPTYLHLFTLFLLKKPYLHARLEFMFKILNIKDEIGCLTQGDFFQTRIQGMQFARRSFVVPTRRVQHFWNKVRILLFEEKESVFDIGFSNHFKPLIAIQVLLKHKDELEEDILYVFDYLYSIS
jgi:hypothetical protein